MRDKMKLVPTVSGKNYKKIMTLRRMMKANNPKKAMTFLESCRAP